MQPRRIYVGRQPILTPECRTAGYELLYRASATAQHAEFSDTHIACLRTLVGVFVDVGAEVMVGCRLAFLNMAPEVIRSDLVEGLPKDRVVLEILESDVADPTLRARCRELRKRGFALALDDYMPGDERAALLPEVDYVKVDLVKTHARALRPLAHALRAHPLKLVAEKVESAEQFQLCQRAGFDFFQGYFFARPTTLSGATIDPARAVILDLMSQLAGEVDLDCVENTLKQHVPLGLNLLRLVNSVALARADKIATVRQALILLGQRQLHRWLTMLLFAGSDPRGVASPLLEIAALRGRLMELVAGRVEAAAGGTPGTGDRAFLAGMLSLVDALLDAPLENILEQIRVEDEIRSAVLEHAGLIGELLALAENVERGDFQAAEGLFERFDLDPEELLRVQTDAYRWLAGVERAGDASE